MKGAIQQAVELEAFKHVEQRNKESKGFLSPMGLKEESVKTSEKENATESGLEKSDETIRWDA